MPGPENRTKTVGADSPLPQWVCGVFCLLALSADIAAPRGIEGGVAYVPLIICCMWFARPQMAFVFAAIATGLTAAVFVVKPPHDADAWMVAVDRMLMLVMLWFVAALVTARKQTEMKLRRYTQALERSNKELDDFAHIVSHDLKEPLRGLFNNARFLEADYKDKLDAEGVKRLARLGYLAQRMEQLINDLFHFSRLGREELAIRATDLNAVIRDIESMMETTLTEHNATIAIPRPLPQITCDKTRITEIFRNLITNAVKYNESEKKIVEIGQLPEVKTRDSVQKQVFYVRDNGIGIAPEFHDKIFRIFQRLHKEQDDKKGTGAGLTFVRRIVERHGGQIWLESEPGKGATFYFTVAQVSPHETVI